jgi:hypothetical protein
MHAAVTGRFIRNATKPGQIEPNGLDFLHSAKWAEPTITTAHICVTACEKSVPSQGDSAAPYPSHRPAHRWPEHMKRTKIMKRILLATALILSAGTAVYADSMSGSLSADVALQVSRLMPNADLSNLTSQQVSALENLFSDSENLKSGSNPVGAVGVILGLY